MHYAITFTISPVSRGICCSELWCTLQGHGDKAEVEKRVLQLREEIETSPSEWEIEKLKERLAKLSAGVAAIKVINLNVRCTCVIVYTVVYLICCSWLILTGRVDGSTHSLLDIFIPASFGQYYSAEGGYVFTSVCLSVSLSVRRITEKVVNGF